MKGSIKDFTSVELTIEDIFPMDKGTTGSTGYELGDEIIEYRMSNPESLSWKLGMVHSHHNMESYFSGVDMSELSDNTEVHNYYLSLVVNNRGDLVAKVAFRGEIKGYECLDEQGKPWTLELSKDRQAMFTFDCDIVSPKTYTKVPASFVNRTEEIIKEAHDKAIVYQNAKNRFPTQYKPKTLPYGVQSWRRNSQDSETKDFNDSFFPHKDFEEEKTQEEKHWDFARFVLRLGQVMDKGDTIEDALEDSTVGGINIEEYVRKIVTMYPALFEKYWDIFGEINTEVFLSTTAEVLEVFENYTGLFEVVEPLITNLESMVYKMTET